MKQIDVLKLGDKIWIRKPKGYRIRCSELKEGERVVLTMPSEENPAMDSDVGAWRMAIKLSESGEASQDGHPQYTDITVIDDTGEPIRYYVTNSVQILNPIDAMDA
jgi:hypothetical protein